MKRYIDANKLIAHLKDEIKECEIPSRIRANGKSITYGTALGLKCAISYAETLPAANVVPVEELELWKNERFNYYQRLGCYGMTRQMVAREIFEEIDEILRYHGITIGLVFDEANGANMAIGRIEKMISELKKKYTEEKQYE